MPHLHIVPGTAGRLRAAWQNGGGHIMCLNMRVYRLTSNLPSSLSVGLECSHGTIGVQRAHQAALVPVSIKSKSLYYSVNGLRFSNQCQLKKALQYGLTFTHSCTHSHNDNDVSHAKARASWSGAFRVRSLAQGHLHTQGSNWQPSGYKPTSSTS